MPVFEDLKRKKKGPLPKRDGTLPGPVKAPEAPAPVMTRVRILRAIRGSRHGSFAVGQSVELPVDLARSWVSMGLAEQDKMIESAPETK